MLDQTNAKPEFEKRKERFQHAPLSSRNMWFSVCSTASWACHAVSSDLVVADDDGPTGFEGGRANTLDLDTDPELGTSGGVAHGVRDKQIEITGKNTIFNYYYFKSIDDNDDDDADIIRCCHKEIERVMLGVDPDPDTESGGDVIGTGGAIE